MVAVFLYNCVFRILQFEATYSHYLCVQDGRTPLYQASKKGHLAVVQLLLRDNADARICNKVNLYELFGCYQIYNVTSGHDNTLNTL